MKALIRKYAQCTRKYQQFKNGIELIFKAENINLLDFLLEYENIFEHEKGIYYNGSGLIVFDTDLPNVADFQDYAYLIINLKELTHE